ncbi:MAG: DNA polymerase III subunit beta [Planctomycetaceae bacterium]|nr:DNA polymerase III subunit beta [Planctomycetaceae bacterium]
MKFVCDREKLLAAFQTAATVAPSRSPKSILQNVKLVVTQEQATLLATDMETGIRIDVPGIEVEALGSAVLPVVRFGSILRESVDTQLRVEADPQGLRVRGDRSEFNLPGQNPDEFPEVAAFEDEAYHEVSARLLKELIRRTLFATDTESSRYALGGVLLEFVENQIIAVGTDGRRLAKMEGPCVSVGQVTHVDGTTIVPSRSMQLIERAFTDLDATIRIAVHANDVLLKSPQVTIYSRLVEGRFPKWRDVFPQRREAVRIQMAVGPVHAALRQAAIVANEDSRGIDFAFVDGSLVLSASTAEVGQSRVEMPVGYSGPPLTVSLDHRFVSDFLKALDPEKTFTFDVESTEAAALFTTDDGYGYVVMPLARDR